MVERRAFGKTTELDFLKKKTILTILHLKNETDYESRFSRNERKTHLVPDDIAQPTVAQGHILPCGIFFACYSWSR